MLTTPEDWASLLVDWADAARATEHDLPSSFSHSPASDDALAAAESRLKLTVPLPPSYRAFLHASNGWQFASSAVPVLRSLAHVAWFRGKNREWIAAYSDPHVAGPLPPDELYFNYSAEAACFYNPKHFRQTLQISDVGDAAVFLLNPMVVHPDGEWEAWFLADWQPGVQRFRSFAALMQSQYCQLIGAEETAPGSDPVPMDDLPTVYRDPPTVASRRVVPRKPARPVPQLLRIAQDHSPRTTMNARIKAIQELSARRDRSTIPPLRALLHDPLPDVCAHAMIALGTLRAVEAVPDLIALVQAQARDHHCAIAALGEIGTAPAIDFLVEYLESRAWNAAAAAAAISHHQDPRGVAALERIMRDADDQFLGDIAGRLLAEFGAIAIDPLIAATGDPEPVVRGRAHCGLSDLACMRATTSEGRRAVQALRECRNSESDPQLSEMLDTHLKTLPRQR